MRTTCCPNLPPPSSKTFFNTNNTKPPPQLPLVKDEACWRRQCIVMKMACTLIGLQVGNLVTVAGALALPPPPPSPVAAAAAKWSEKRMCPSWHHNSLETVVPENLPRPAARRRYQSVRSSTSKIAPPLSLSASSSHINTDDCFSM